MRLLSGSRIHEEDISRSACFLCNETMEDRTAHVLFQCNRTKDFTQQCMFCTKKGSDQTLIPLLFYEKRSFRSEIPSPQIKGHFNA